MLFFMGLKWNFGILLIHAYQLTKLQHSGIFKLLQSRKDGQNTVCVLCTNGMMTSWHGNAIRIDWLIDYFYFIIFSQSKQMLKHNICSVITHMESNRIMSLYVHPCEKVIGILFRHKYFTIYFLLFALVVIHNICEVVNINFIDFCWISIIGYASVTFWKRLLG